MKKPIRILALFALITSLKSMASAEEASGFKNESEAGVVTTSGNSDSQSYSLKQLNSYAWTKNSLKLTGGYLKTSNNGVDSAESWNFGLRFEHALSNRLSGFISENVEGDIFAGYKQRYNSDLGIKYSIVNSERLKWFTEGGYRFTHENQINGKTLDYSLLRLYTEAEKFWSQTVSTKLWVEGLPNLSDSDNWQLNSELSVSAILTSVFSVKSGYLVKYDNQPAANVAKTTDSVFTTTLVAKF